MRKNLAAALFILLISPFECRRIDQAEAFLKVTSRTGELIRVRPEYEERYIIIHKHTFPGVLSRIYKSNMRNYTIFLRDGILFAHHEYVGTDPATDAAAIKADPVTQEWWKLTDPMQEPLENRKPGEWWASMEELLHIDARQMDYRQVHHFAFTAEILPDQESPFRQVIADNHELLTRLAEPLHTQNLSLFIKERTVYVYFEYYGEDEQADLQALIQNKSFEPIMKQISGIMCHPLENQPCWQPMREVFHTN
ncbi:MAG: L-rhamnose mutarotase [Calditrichaeota bacterium]|nr:MAG: L-rhamnose mutarotase [Calditrichota bacterium]